MDGGSFYRNGSSMTNLLSRNPDRFDYGGLGHSSGSMYEFPSGQIGGGIEQKIDRMVSLMLEQNTISSNIQSETIKLTKVVESLTADITYVKKKVESSTYDSSNSGSIRKKIPSELSVSQDIT